MSVIAPSIQNPNFGYVVLAVVAITFHCTWVTMSVGMTRYKVFSDDYIEKNLKKENGDVKLLNGKGIGKGCHPDTGLGRFSKDLTTEQWMELNIAQRCAGNYHEQLVSIVVLELLAGLFYPRLSAYVGLVYLFSRILYTYGFKNQLKKEAPFFARNRGLGFMGCFLCQFTLIGVSVYSALVMTNTISHQEFIKNFEAKWN